MRRVTITEEVTEEGGGWVLDESPDTPGAFVTYFPTASEAERFVRAEDRVAADETGAAQVTVIEWTAVTRVGRMVVSAITGAK